MGAECCRLIPDNSVTPKEGLVVRVSEEPNRMVERVGISRGPDRLAAATGALVALMHRCRFRFSLRPGQRVNSQYGCSKLLPQDQSN